MSSNRAEPASGPKSRPPLSITARLTVLYAVSAYVMLIVTTAFLNWILMTGLERADTDFVADKVHRLAWALQHRSEDLRFVSREVNWDGGPHGVARNHVFYSRILDREGREVIATPAMASAIPDVQFPPPVGLERISEPEVVQHWRSPEGKVYCLVSVRLRDEQSGQPWVIQVAMEDTEERVTVAMVQRASLAVLLLGILLSAGLGSMVARRGMRPLRDIAMAAERITVGQLNERIDPARQPKELASLANALNQMLSRLEAGFTRMSQFAADVAHELRTPIHNMMGEAEIAVSAKRNPEEYCRILESNLEEFDRLARMIDRMLFIARVEDPRQRIALVRLDARREIEAVIEFFDALIESRGVTVAAQGSGEINADPMLFRRALTNLLSNALRYTPRGGGIVVSVEQAGDGMARVKVADTGSGIRLEYLPHVFDRMNRRDQAGAQTSEHSGLGLSIVKSIVELHGGSLMISSALGKGTTVLMRFPAAAAVPPETRSAPGHSALASPSHAPVPGQHAPAQG